MIVQDGSLSCLIFICFQMSHVEVNEAYKEIKTDEGLIENLITCIHYATWRHKDQRRNDSKKTPYINHPVGKCLKTLFSL